MSNCNEIIERLENLAKHAVHYVGEPPFVMSLDDGIALHDAIDLLKAREPRVMTLEEVCNLKYDDVVYYQGINTNSVESAIVLHGGKMVPEVNTRVVQFRHADGTGGWNGINNADLNGYGKKWRCWTSRPTPEQTRNTKWEDSNNE